MSRSLLAAASSLVLLCGRATAQERLDVEHIDVCSYYGEEFTDDLYAFASDEEAVTFVASIMEHTGLPQNFTIKAANVPNAAAVFREGQRLILYSQSFLRQIAEQTGTKWGSTSIMAHEIGHHLAGHTLSKNEKRPDLELEADKFSGHILYKMGATIEEAKIAMERQAGAGGSKTHPPKSARLAAIHNGWVLAEQQDPNRKRAAADGRSLPVPAPETVEPPAERPRSIPRSPRSVPARPEPSASIFIAGISHDVPVAHPQGLPGGPGMVIHLGGSVRDASGTSLQVVVRFFFQHGPALFPDAREQHFRGPGGALATGTPHLPVSSDRVDLSTFRVTPIPYYALNLAPTNFNQTYALGLVADVLLDGQVVATSPGYDFTLRW